MNIEGIEIGENHPCRFVAEISNNHNGSFQRALRLIEAAKSAGADMVKMQCYTPDELLALRGDGPAPEPWGSQGWSMRTLYEKARTPLDWFPSLFQRARRIGIVPFASVFGAESLAVLQSVDCPAYKIARLDNHDVNLLTVACEVGKPVLVSHSDLLHLMGIAGCPPVHPLYCPPGYPTPAEDVKLPKFFGADPWQKPESGWLGLSSHCLDPALPIAAVARGAKLLEYHFHLCNEPSELEANVSMNEFQFNQMVHDVRRTEAMMA